MNAVDLRGVTPLHLALSRLRVIGGEDSPEGVPLTRKKEISQVVACAVLVQQARLWLVST